MGSRAARSLLGPLVDGYRDLETSKQGFDRPSVNLSPFLLLPVLLSRSCCLRPHALLPPDWPTLCFCTYSPGMDRTLIAYQQQAVCGLYVLWRQCCQVTPGHASSTDDRICLNRPLAADADCWMQHNEED